MSRSGGSYTSSIANQYCWVLMHMGYLTPTRIDAPRCQDEAVKVLSPPLSEDNERGEAQWFPLWFEKWRSQFIFAIFLVLQMSCSCIVCVCCLENDALAEEYVHNLIATKANIWTCIWIKMTFDSCLMLLLWVFMGAQLQWRSVDKGDTQC